MLLNEEVWYCKMHVVWKFLNYWCQQFISFNLKAL